MVKFLVRKFKIGNLRVIAKALKLDALAIISIYSFLSLAVAFEIGKVGGICNCVKN